VLRLAPVAICAAALIEDAVAGVPPRTERVGLGLTAVPNRSVTLPRMLEPPRR
jgi:hypothetical protein